MINDMTQNSKGQKNRGKFSLYIKELRVPFISASVLPMGLGIALAYKVNGELDFSLAVLTLLCGTLIHLVANTLNDLYDFKAGSDNSNVIKTPFSGGSGMLTEGHLTCEEVKKLALILIVATFITGLLTLLLSPGETIVILFFGFAGIFLGSAYTVPPLKLSYRGMGEVAIFLAFGPLPVLASYYMMSGKLSIDALIASIPLGLMTTAILWINQFPDYKTDKRAGKKTLVVRLGLERSRYIYYCLIISSFIALFAIVIFTALPAWSLLGLIFTAPAAKASQIVHKNYKEPLKLIPAMAMTIFSHLILGLLIIVGTFI